jgi:hypothetical protein
MSVIPLGGLLGRATPDPTDTGRARFVALTEVGTLVAEAEAQGFLPVLVQPLRPADRGKLALVLEEAVESVLERRGACPPGVGAATDLDASLSDQLYRARLVEARGLCLFLGSLEGSATLASALDAEDSAVLRWWLDAARTRPVRLLIDEANRGIAVYGAPIPLGTLLRELDSGDADDAPNAPEAAPHVAPDLARSSEAMELSEPPPAVRSHELELKLDDLSPHDPTLVGDVTSALLAELTAESAPPPALLEPVLVEPSPAEPLAEPALAEPALAEPALAEPALAEPAPAEPAPAETPIAETPIAPPVFADEPPTQADEPPVTTVMHGPLHPSAGSDWQQWARELETTRGPKPLAVVERLFVMSYVPLRDAYLRGIAPAEVGPVLEGWATSFATSYREAFAALCVRGKRPTMVLDVPDAALRIGRLHGARSVQLLLVDGLRFDLGLRVELGLRARLGRDVALTERLLLWSALPSTTETQLELIGRGPDGLRELNGSPDSEIPVARGRMARTPRRIKAGHRELLKLDLVEARLSEPGLEESARLDALGVEVADAVAELCEKLPQRTLLCVFGDHGFRLDAQGEGTSALKQGGSRPEEVLVPAFAWLVGGVQ